MTPVSTALRAEAFEAIGEIIQRETAVIIRRWEELAQAEQPNAKRLHHAVLLDHLPNFLGELARYLLQARASSTLPEYRSARVHGDQRWETGWSIAEVVRDYQLLRIAVVQRLQEVMPRPLEAREVMALGLAFDDAIATSVSAYLSCIDSSSDGRRQDQPPGTGYLDYFGILGHELRNFLAPLTNSLHILQVAGHDPQTRDEVRDLMERQVKAMSRLVDDLMDIPRIGRGKLSLKAEHVDVTRLVQQCLEDRLPAFQEAGLHLEWKLPSHPLWTIGDPTRLAQVIGNLLNNAMKFTDRGGQVSVSVAEVPQRGTAEVRVKDTGIGIDAAALPQIFEPFAQVAPSVERDRGGLGLGLALVNGLVELHGGHVRAKSGGLGNGSEFIVELPVCEDLRQGKVEDRKQASRATHPRRVLIIEDNEDMAATTRMVLELNGHTVWLASTGPTGLALARSLRPDVIICDIGLPGLDGYGICRELLNESQPADTLRIALSGHGSNGSRERALEAGFHVFLLKPVNPAEIARIVADADTGSAGKF